MSGLLLEPVRGIRQIGHRVHALLDIVEMAVGFAVAGGAAHVGREDGVAVMHEVLNEEMEIRLKLRLRPAMHDHDHRQVMAGRAGRLVKPRRDRSTIERGVVHDLRGDESIGRDAAMRAAGHGLHPIGLTSHTYTSDVCVALVNEKASCCESAEKHSI